VTALARLLDQRPPRIPRPPAGCGGRPPPVVEEGALRPSRNHHHRPARRHRVSRRVARPLALSGPSQGLLNL